MEDHGDIDEDYTRVIIPCNHQYMETLFLLPGRCKLSQIHLLLQPVTVTDQRDRLQRLMLIKIEGRVNRVHLLQID